MVICYRFTENILTGITENRYARLCAGYMERLWIPALRRLMAAKGWKQQQLADGSGVRPNTISDLLSDSDPRIETLAALAKALDVPLWALFCTAHEHALFTQHAKQADAEAVADQHREDLRTLVRAELEPLAEALLVRLTGQSVAQPAKPLPVRPTLAPVHKSPHRKRKRSA